jgi:Zn-finger nucleic acid-binding protein
MKCPKCEGVLNKVTIKMRPEYGADILNDAEQTTEIEVDQCISCNGVWFDAKELNQYLAEKLLILDSPKVADRKKHEQKEGLCPKCNQPMKKRPAPKGARFTTDVCEKCQGVWLDSSEIDRLEFKNFTFGEKHALVWRDLMSYFSGGSRG